MSSARFLFMVMLVVGGVVALRAAPVEAEIDRLIEQLGSEKFEQREAAAQRLKAIGEVAIDALREAAAKHDDPEVRARAKAVIKSIGNRFETLRLDGHTQAVNSVAFTPDGRQVLTGSGDCSVRLWDAATGKEVRRFLGHTQAVWSVAISGDGRRVVSAGQDGVVRLWDAAGGKEVRSFAGHKMGALIASVAFTPDGKRIVSGSWDETARIWDVATGQEVNRFELFAPVVKLAVSRDGRYALLGGGNGALRLGEIRTGKQVRGFSGHQKTVWAVALSPDGTQALSGAGRDTKDAPSVGSDNSLRLWDVGSGARLLRLEGHTDGIRSVAFSPDGRRAASGSLDGTVRLWDLSDGRQVAVFEGHKGGVECVAFSPDGRKVVSGGSDQTARVWAVPAN